MIVVLLVLGSIGVALAILLAPPKPELSRAWKLRASWALWTLQPALFLGALVIGLIIVDRYGYDSSNLPHDVASWLTLGMLAPVGAALLAGTVLGGLAWREARSETSPTSRRWWALAAVTANVLWLTVGAWMIGSIPIAAAIDVVGLGAALLLLVWPVHRRDSGETVPPSVPAPQPQGISTSPSVPLVPTTRGTPPDPIPTAIDDHLVG